MHWQQQHNLHHHSPTTCQCPEHSAVLSGTSDDLSTCSSPSVPRLPFQCKLSPHSQPPILPSSVPSLTLDSQYFHSTPALALDNAYAPTLLHGDPTPHQVPKTVLIGRRPMVHPPGQSLGLGALRQPGLESASVKGTGGAPAGGAACAGRPTLLT